MFSRNANMFCITYTPSEGIFTITIPIINDNAFIVAKHNVKYDNQNYSIIIGYHNNQLQEIELSLAPSI